MEKGKSGISLQQQTAIGRAGRSVSDETMGRIPHTSGRKTEEHERGSVAKRITTSMGLNDASVSEVELEEDRLETDLTQEIDSDDLSEILDIMGMDDAVDVIAGIPRELEDEDSANFQELLRYSDSSASGKATAKSRKRRKDMVEDTMEDMEEKPRFRRLVVTCRYCGRLYSFRTDQPQPPTCGSPQCITKLEGHSKDKLAEK
jgi:rubrerythrin